MFLMLLGGLLIVAFVYGLVSGDRNHWLFKAGVTLVIILVIGAWLAVGVIQTLTM